MNIKEDFNPGCVIWFNIYSLIGTDLPHDLVQKHIRVQNHHPDLLLKKQWHVPLGARIHYQQFSYEQGFLSHTLKDRNTAMRLIISQKKDCRILFVSNP